MLSRKEMRRELPWGQIRVLMSGEGGRNGRTGGSGRQGVFHKGQCHSAVWKIRTLTAFVLKHSLPKLGTKVFMNVHQHLSCETQQFFHRLSLIWVRPLFFCGIVRLKRSK